MKPGAAPFPIITQRTETLRAKLKFARVSRHGDRAIRFSKAHGSRQGSAPVKFDFAQIASLPDWLLADAERRSLIGICAAILSKRSAIDRELSGEKLSAIGALVGGDLFERLCDYPADDIALADPGNRLSRPEDFKAIGEDIVLRALPAAFGEGEIFDIHEKQERSVCALAARIIAMQDGVA